MDAQNPKKDHKRDLKKKPEIPPGQQTPLVKELLTIIEQQATKILEQEKLVEQLKEEIAELKKHKTRPKIQPSKMDEEAGKDEEGQDDEGEDDGKADGTNTNRRKKNKKGPKRGKSVTIHHTERIPAENVPEGSTFKGYEKYIVQDLIIQPNNTCYLLEQWETPEGKYVSAKVPESIRGKHYGHELVSHILHQYHGQLVTQPLLLEYLRDLGFEISSGQLSNLLIKDKEIFHQEKDEILVAGKEVSNYLHTDDTGSRHQGKNGYCTHIGNELFAWFESTESKSRINFLELLRAVTLESH